MIVYDFNLSKNKLVTLIRSINTSFTEIERFTAYIGVLALQNSRIIELQKVPFFS